MIVLRAKHHRHTVVDAAHQRVRFADDDGRRQNLLARDPCELPQASKRERLLVGADEAPRLLAVVVGDLPLEEARRRDQRRALGEPPRGTVAACGRSRRGR
jgi:hypothetical protein